jgi:hypothetical protein
MLTLTFQVLLAASAQFIGMRAIFFGAALGIPALDR